MRITAYCLGYQHWTVLPHQLKDDFDRMKHCGFNAVAFSFSESEMRYARRTFELQVGLAHEAGLKVFVVPSRLGGRLAGAPLMPSIWLAQNPEAQIPVTEKGQDPLACLENEAFREWIKDFMETLLRDYPLDGIIWDEPKGLDVRSLHPDTIKRFGENPTVEQMENGFADFLEDLTAHCCGIRDDLEVTLFNMPHVSKSASLKLAALPGIDYAGFDGRLAPESFFHEKTRDAKTRAAQAWERTLEESRQTGKKTFILLENMLMPKTVMDEYEENLENFLANHRPDHLSLYFYGHNNEDPEGIYQIMKKAMRKHLPR